MIREYKSNGLPVVDTFEYRGEKHQSSLRKWMWLLLLTHRARKKNHLLKCESFPEVHQNQSFVWGTKDPLKKLRPHNFVKETLFGRKR